MRYAFDPEKDKINQGKHGISLRRAAEMDWPSKTNMSKMVEPEYGTPDEENPEWTAERFAKAKRFHELPPKLQAALRGMQTATFIEEGEEATLTLKSDLAAALKATGPDWEKRAEEALCEKSLNKAA